MEKTTGQPSIGAAPKITGIQPDQHLSPEITSGALVGGVLTIPNTPTMLTQNNLSKHKQAQENYTSQSKHIWDQKKKSLQEDYTTLPHLKEHRHYLLKNPYYPRSKKQSLKASASLSTSCQLQQYFPQFLKDPLTYLYLDQVLQMYPSQLQHQEEAPSHMSQCQDHSNQHK